MDNKIKEYIEELKTNSLVKKNNRSFLSIETYDCYLNNGQKITREKLLKNSGDGSAVIIYPITTDNKVILAIEPRVFTKETIGVSLPAGYIEKDEYPYAAAKRELLEETGYMSNNIIYLGSFYQDEGVSSAYNHYFLAYDCQKVSEQKLDKDEYIKYILVTEEELQELLNAGYITGINSAYTIEKVKNFQLRR